MLWDVVAVAQALIAIELLTTEPYRSGLRHSWQVLVVSPARWVVNQLNR